MHSFFGLGAKVAATLGSVICLVAGLMRVAGHSYVAGFESITLFIGGMAIMLFGALLKMEAIHIDLSK